MIIILIIVAVVMGFYYGWKAIKKPTHIKAGATFSEQALLTAMMFWVISGLMLIEISAVPFIISRVIPSTKSVWLLCQIVDGGLLAGVIPFVCSMLFEKLIESCDLDLNDKYSENYIKIIFSCVVLLNVICYFIMFEPEMMGENNEIDKIISRVIIWLLNVMGAWLGLGFHCEGRIKRQLIYIEDSKESNTKIDYFKHYIPSLIALMICGIIWFGAILQIKVLTIGILYVLHIGMCGMIGATIGVWIYIFLFFPSVRKSDKRLKRAIRKKKARMHENVVNYYQGAKYTFETKGEDVYMKVHNREIVWPGHEGEVDKVCNIPEEKIYDLDYFVIRKKLQKYIKDRRDFVVDKFAQCRNELHDQLIEERRNKR